MIKHQIKKIFKSILPSRMRITLHKLIYFSKRGEFKHIYKKSIEKIFQKQFLQTSISSLSTHQGREYNLQNQQVLYIFPVIDWSFRIQRPQQIAKEFHLNHYQVIYFTTTFYVAKTPGYSLLVGDGNILIITLFLNEPKNIYKEKLNDQNISFLLMSINLLEKELLINNRVSIVDHPFWFPLAEKLSGGFTIYDCMDYHPGFGDESAHLVELEEMAMTQSDILVLTSQDLYQRFSHKNENSILIRNGCEFKYFNAPPITIYKSKFKKVVGYYGAISSWFDATTVIALAKRFSEYEFLLVGSTYGCENLNDLKKLSNVTLVGEVAYDQLTKYLYAFDVAIMPFMVNELTIATNPVKVYEYLSSGVPVVSTRLPEVELMGDVVYTASDISEFESCIQKALDINDDESIQKRITFAHQNDWQSRYSQIEKEITKVKAAVPRVSIILVTYNNLELTKDCLYSMERFNNYENCEIIVVDNLSTDGTREFLSQYESEHKNFKAILHDSNSGFAAGNNIGIREAAGDIIILLNNDTYVTPNWVQNLIKHFDTDEKIGMVGPRTNNIGNEARLYSEYQSNEEMIEKSYDVYYQNQSKQYEIKVLAFFCVAIKQEVIEKVGLLDEVYGIGMFEDDDYCMNAKEAGYTLICADDVFIHHHLGASFNKNPEWKEKLFQKNKAIYESRWGKWEGHTYR
jgi:GT2 family glycosyltransferase/glycosyltransferase involved in cell wall biosynthesis